MAEGGAEIHEAMASPEPTHGEERKNVPRGTGSFEDEWEEMKGVVFQQSRTINDLSAKIMNLRLEPPSNRRTVIIKPRDVSILNLQKLEGLESAGTLNIFFDLIEQCTPDDKERVRVAK